MNHAQLFADIDARLRADTGAAGLFPTGGSRLVTGIWNNQIIGSIKTPLIVWDLISSVNDDYFEGDAVDIVFELTVMVDNKGGVAALETARKILGRIYGDAIKQANKTPTFGLHRHRLVSSWQDIDNFRDAWEYTTVRRLNGRQAHTEEDYVYIEQFGVKAFKTYASYES